MRISTVLAHCARNIREQASAMHGCHDLMSFPTFEDCEAGECLEATQLADLASRLARALRQSPRRDHSFTDYRKPHARFEKEDPRRARAVRRVSP